MSADEICDFCLEPNPTWVYATRPFIVRNLFPDNKDYVDLGDGFASCDKCRECIERKWWTGLILRGAESRKTSFEEDAFECDVFACRLVQAFKQNLIGGPHPNVTDTAARA